MAISKYNMSVIENTYFGLKGTAAKFKVVKQLSERQMIWKVSKGNVEKLVFIDNGELVSCIAL